MRDCGGAVRRVVCVANSARRASLRNAPAITWIANALPSRTRVTVLTNDRSAFIVPPTSKPRRVALPELPKDSAFTIWPQDPFVVLVGPDDKHIYLASKVFEREDDRLIPRTLARRFKVRCKTCSLSFEDGNVVAGGRHVFIGADTILQNARQLGITRDEASRAFERQFGIGTLIIGPAPQPVAHIDMILTPIDDENLLLADPGWGARIMDAELRKHPQGVREFEKACVDYYFGDPSIASIVSAKGRRIKRPDIVGTSAKAVAETRAIDRQLDTLADRLRRWGYKVHRVPYLFRLARFEAQAAEANAAVPRNLAQIPEEDLVSDYPCMTYNNVLMESVGSRRTVYLPQYGFTPMDRAARRVWQRMGFKVVPVGGLTISSMYGGSLRCCTKVLDRD